MRTTTARFDWWSRPRSVNPAVAGLMLRPRPSITTDAAALAFAVVAAPLLAVANAIAPAMACQSARFPIRSKSLGRALRAGSDACAARGSSAQLVPSLRGCRALKPKSSVSLANRTSEWRSDGGRGDGGLDSRARSLLTDGRARSQRASTALEAPSPCAGRRRRDRVRDDGVGHKSGGEASAPTELERHGAADLRAIDPFAAHRAQRARGTQNEGCCVRIQRAPRPGARGLGDERRFDDEYQVALLSRRELLVTL